MTKQVFLFLVLLTPLFSIAQETQIVFKVDMTNELSQVKKTKTIGIRGNLPPLSWDRTFNMTDEDQDGIYVATVNFSSPGDAVLEYKFIHDKDSWELAQDNRIVALTEGSQELPVATWNELPPNQLTDLPKIKSKDLLEDLALLKRAYTQMHPGLFRYLTPETLDQTFKETAAYFQKDRDLKEAYLAFSRLSAKVKCGHTYANFYNQMGTTQKVLFEQPDKVPFTFKFIQNIMVIEYGLTGQNKLARGQEIMAINGVETSEIIATLLQYVKADGINDQKRMYELQLTGYGKYEAFDIFFPLLFPPKEGQYELTLKAPKTQELSTITVKAIKRSQRLERLNATSDVSITSIDDLWNFELLDKNLAYMQMGSFAVWQMEKSWKGFLKDNFKQLEKENIPNLIIDVRGNEGGLTEVVQELSKYLLKKPVKTSPNEQRVKYQTIPEDLAAFGGSWDPTYKDFTKMIAEQKEDYYLLKTDTPDNLPASSKAYKGQVFLLIDAANSSATHTLATLAKQYELATLVGQETGASQRGINGGYIFFLNLPNSKVEMDIPLIGYFATTPKPAGGTEPDILVELSIEDFINHVDVEVKTVQELIQSK